MMVSMHWKKRNLSNKKRQSLN